MDRVALYARVSSEEQAIKGFSIEAQLDDLRAYAKRNTLKIVGEYVDEGISARKKWQKRDSFVRMMEDVEADKIDLILFIKLDRWFRSVADYYEVQRILDNYGVDWKCTQEEYDTTTANGKLMLNLKLAIAQDEADRTSERIKFIQANKVRNGEVISGSVPFGFYIEKTNGRKRLFIDKEKMEIVKDSFDYFHKCQSIRKARAYVSEKYGINWTFGTFKAMLFNDLYFGSYRGNDGFCEAPFTRDYIEEIRRTQLTYKQWSRRAKHIYIFGGIVRCPVCGSRMSGTVDVYKGVVKHYYYRCPKHFNYRACDYNQYINEERMEEYLLANIEKDLENHIITIKEKERKHDENAKAIKKIEGKIQRLKELYVEDYIDKDEFDSTYDEFIAMIKELEPKSHKPIAEVTKAVQVDFPSIYDSLSREQRRTLWRSILESIEISTETKLPTAKFL